MYCTVLCENMNNWSRWFRILRKNGGQKTCDAVPFKLAQKVAGVTGTAPWDVLAFGFYELEPSEPLNQYSMLKYF